MQSNMETQTDRGSGQPQKQPVFITYTGSPYPVAGKLLGADSRIVSALTGRINMHTRSRPLEYMKALAEEQGATDLRVLKSPDGDFGPIASGSDVVLLWPDPIGTGCQHLERRLMRTGAKITVVTGRKRTFPLTGARWRKVRFRRFMEKYLVAEFAFLGVFCVVTPFLVIWDLARGKR
jgi:hypothetical protein